MRVTYVVPSLEIGGAERQLVLLANGLDRRSFQPAIVCLGPARPLLDELAADVPVRGLGRARTASLAGGRLLRGALTGPVLLADLLLHRPDIVHAYLPAAYVPSTLVARLLRVRPIVAGRRSLQGIEAYPHRPWRLLAELANAFIDLHVCNSEAARRMTLATERVRPARTAVVRNGCLVPPSDVPPAVPPSAWGIGSDLPAAVCLANLLWYKGHEVLLRATGEVVKRFPGFRLVLVGEGPERTRVERLVAELGLEGSVVRAGSVGGASRLLPCFRFSVLASLEESFPNAALESMAAGLPVVATRVGGIPELVRDGVDGLLVPAAEPGRLAQAMLRLLRDPELCRRMGRAARERVQADFSVEAMVRQTEDLYFGLLAEPATPRSEPEAQVTGSAAPESTPVRSPRSRA